jgi:polyhydroxyalkanoate synthesis repressor PhaR
LFGLVEWRVIRRRDGEPGPREEEPAVRALRIGGEGGEVFRPQRKEASRQIVCSAHLENYRPCGHVRQRSEAQDWQFDEAETANLCIVAMQHLCVTQDHGPMTNQTAAPPGTAKAPVVVKKYANRRLYNTATSSYVTLEDLAKMIKDGGDFVVYDAKTGEDITRSVLTQIIVEQEQKGQNLLPISFLRQLISFYGDSMQFLVPGYLDQAMVAFAKNQEQMRDSLRATFGIFPFGQFEEMGKQNIALFERALKMLSPYARDVGPAAAPPAAAREAKTEGEDPRLRRLEAQIEALRQQLDALGRDRK